MSKLVHKTLADSPLTPARKRKLAQLAARPEAEINFSEIPPLEEALEEHRVLREAMLQDLKKSA